MPNMDARDASLKFLNNVYQRCYGGKIVKAYYSRQSADDGNIFVAMVQNVDGELDPVELELQWHADAGCYVIDFIQVAGNLLGNPDYDDVE